MLFCATIVLLSFFNPNTAIFFYFKCFSKSNLDWIVAMQLHLNVGVFFLRSVGDNWHFQLF